MWCKANQWILYKGLAVTSDNLVRLPSLSFQNGREKRIAYLSPLPRERGRVVNPLPGPGMALEWCPRTTLEVRQGLQRPLAFGTPHPTWEVSIFVNSLHMHSMYSVCTPRF